MTEPATFPLHLPPLGLGTGTQGNLRRAVSDAEAEQVFQAAWDAGLRYYDTAPWYGRGLAEERLGAFLRDKNGWQLSSKVGRLLREDVPPHASQIGAFEVNTPRNVVYDYSYDGVMRSYEESLERMGVAHIDVLFIHDPDVVGVGVRELMAGAHRALVDLRDQGAIRGFGAGMNEWQLPLELVRAGDFDTFLLAGRYTLLEQESLPFMDECARRGARVVIGGVFNSGLLANPRPGANYNYAAAPEGVLERALRLQEVCAAHGVPLTTAALQFVYGHPAVASVLVADHHPERILQNVAALQTAVPGALWTELRAQGLIDPAAPLPRPPTASAR
ncbi:aldo/keto reductase [Deinococcus sp. KSM4-11]|uniref:aldo/keto reductase n=1 Tax=Deinococcus sp. KSM4-11 TaxID=2568654 RepID=UPI0010A319DA|nr:aldo/keto reductase [Deinococcus sp. KSM4-11]THF87364.1 aldo/keto reductase [Deinococcus sp. KSM4-11]